MLDGCGPECGVVGDEFLPLLDNKLIVLLESRVVLSVVVVVSVEVSEVQGVEEEY